MYVVVISSAGWGFGLVFIIISIGSSNIGYPILSPTPKIPPGKDSITDISGLYYKTITIVIMTIVSDATIWSVTFDAARGVIYDRNMAIPHVYGTGIICDDRQMTIVIVL